MNKDQGRLAQMAKRSLRKSSIFTLQQARERLSARIFSVAAIKSQNMADFESSKNVEPIKKPTEKRKNDRTVVETNSSE